MNTVPRVPHEAQSADNEPAAAPPGSMVRPRPPLLRAMGLYDPPLSVRVEGRVYRRLEILKHDSWAATAVYAGAGGRIVCKFNRQQPILGIPVAWLGRFLARREGRLLRRLQRTGHVPPLLRQPWVDGRRLRHAVAHEYVPGHPLSPDEWVNDRFFPRLRAVLRRMHGHGMAYVDLHKRENVIVGDDGRPYLVDFQISLCLPRRWPARSRLARATLRWFQDADEYHLLKHWARHRPDQCPLSAEEVPRRRPWPVRLHRLVGVPFRWVRRRLLVCLGIRSGRGMAESEYFAEDAVRRCLRPGLGVFPKA